MSRIPTGPLRRLAPLRRHTLRGQLTALLVLASSVVVLVSSAAFSAISSYAWREAEAEAVASVARLLARNTEAALAFRVAEDAEKVLASLSTRPSITRAAIYDRDGLVFATYRRDPGSVGPPPGAAPDGPVFDDGSVRVQAPVRVQDRVEGAVVLEDDLSAVRAALRRNLWVFLGVLGASLLLAWAVAARLQGVVSKPLLSLTGTARAAQAGDWSVRSDVRRDDEIGLLARAFNRMLEAIQAEMAERQAAEAGLRDLAATLEQKVDQRTLDLKRSNEELERFAYVASHDLQEPLRMVASYTDLLAKRYEGKLDEKADKYIYYATDGAQRMQAMLDDLLQVSRVGTRGKPPGPVALEAVVQQALANLAVRLTETGGVVHRNGLPTVTGDETQLLQLVQNLLGNALKFRGEAAPRIRVVADAVAGPGPADGPGQGWWHVAVSDNGIGISPEYFDRIFLIFQRLHGRQEYPGSGIGLALCKKIVERHGGTIWVTSTPGAGSTFHFTLPAA